MTFGTDDSNDSHSTTALNLRRITDSLPALIHTARPDGHIDFFNRRWLEYLGLRLEDLEGWKWTAVIHPDDLDGILEKWRAALASGEPFLHETRVRRADGKYRWMLHHKVALRDEKGEIVKWYGSSLDIEERKTAEEQLRRNAQELQRSEFYLAEGQRLAHMGSWAFGPDGFDYWSPELFRMYGLDPASKPPGLQEYLDRVHPHDRESMADLIKGILAKPSTFDAAKRIVRPNGEVRYIRCAGAPAVENQNLKKYVGSAIDVTEHELLTQELRRREAYLAEAQRLSHTGSFGWKPDTGELIWSAETYRIFEYDRSVTPTIDLVVQRVHPEDRADVQSVIERASRGASDFEHAYRLLLPDGRVKHVHALAHATQNASGNREFVGAVTDITEQRRAEESLRESEYYLAEAQRLSQTGSWAWSPNPGRDIRYWSEECYRVLGFDPSGPLPRFEEFFQRIHLDDQAGTRERFEKAIHDKADWELDYRIVHPDKGVRDIHVVGHAVLDPSGELVEFVGTVIDITERKRAERELQQLIDLVPQLIAVVGPDGEFIYVNRVSREYTGLTLEEFRSIDVIGRTIHPDDVEKARAQRKAGFSGIDPFEYEARMHGKDGVYRWFLLRYNPLVEDGRARRWYGTATEIESRKQEEEQVRQENVRLEERTRIAQELHDTLLQSFNAATIKLWAAMAGLPSDSPLKPKIDPILDLMEHGIAEGRTAIQGLRSSDSGTPDLVAALSGIRRELVVPPNMDFHVSVVGSQKPLQAPIGQELYRIGKEALDNAFRHSRAGRVDLELEYADSNLTLRVRDNGCGIDPLVIDKGLEGHWGLAGMRERAARLGGQLNISSAATAGTEIRLSISGDVAFQKVSRNETQPLPARRG